MKNKKGISLIVLVITIIVMIIIASVVVYTSSDSVNNSKLVTFASDLTEIEDLVYEYYLTNNSLPIVSGTTYSKDQVLAKITNGKTKLSSEITSNGDDSAVFYKIDMTKLPIDESIRGIEEDGDATDIYLISSKSLNVYYLKGEKIAGEYYFSLTKALSGKTKIVRNSEKDTSNVTISSTTQGIKLTKSTNEWTNDLTVDVETTLDTNETLQYLVAGEVIGTSTTGTFTINVAEILNTNETVRDGFYSSSENKVLVINKYSTATGTEQLIASSKIDISNVDTLSGAMVSADNITYTEYTDFILAKISGYTDAGGSGVKEARVLYTQKEEDGNVVPYYENLPSTITSEYIKNSGKSSNYAAIKLPNDVANYAIVFIDNAGNVSSPAEYTTLEDITFTVTETNSNTTTTYTTKEYTTWATFVSENSDAFVIQSTGEVTTTTGFNIYLEDTAVKSTDIISNNSVYTFSES